MSNEETHYVGDDVLFRGVIRDDDGKILTSTSVLVDIIQDDGTFIVTASPGTVVGNEVRFQQNNLTEGRFILYFTATIITDVRTKTINYRVIVKDGRQT